MTTTLASAAGTADTSERGQPADVFVAFGITGDLAKVMTFMSLYRLERRGLLDCPILGVAVDDWTVDPRCGRAARPEGLRSLRRPALVRCGGLLRPGHV